MLSLISSNGWSSPTSPEYPSSAVGNQEGMRIKVAAAGDIHCSEEERARLQTAFTEADRQADIILLAGDLTTYGEGFVGGFFDSLLPDFGEPLLRRLYAETSAEVAALERGLKAIRDCAVRIVLLHYSPTKTTIEGEREAIWAFLGSERLARPIAEHRPDAVFHGHGHAGTFAGAIGDLPVFNVGAAVPVRDFWLFEFEPGRGLVREPEEALSGG
jgi:Icc-related predicted phosphoesterase